MSANTPEIAAATLEHSERIRLLTNRVDKQRRSISKLSYAVGVLVVVQALELLPVAMEKAGMPYVSRSMASAFLIGLAVMTVTLLFRWRVRTD
jgi:hypothetical protein